MDTFRFFMPTEVFFGEGSVRNHADRWLYGSKALIVTGQKSAELSGALADVTAVLDAHSIPYTHFNGIGANPSREQVYAGAAAAEGCDFVVAVGGGSPMDAAKAIAWVRGSEIPEADFFGRKPLAEDTVLPIVAIPLTCGTGSEVTPYAVITDSERQAKRNVTGPNFFPKVALLDPAYLKTLPPAVLADTTLDALSHAIEGAYSLRASRLSLSLSERAIAIILPELIRMAHGEFVNLGELMYASMLAGIVIAQAGTGLVHAMGYPLTLFKGMPHGRANGILLSGYLDFMYDSCTDLTERILRAAGLDSTNELQALIDVLMDRNGCDRTQPTEEELYRFAQEPLRLEVMQRCRTMPSRAEVMDIYRNGY